jgi:DNA polymerase-4
VRFDDFTTLTRTRTASAAMDTTHDLVETARDLLGRLGVGRRIRLLGLGAGGLEEATAPRQLGLEGSVWEEVSDAVDRVRERFGPDSIGPAGLSEKPR